MIDISSYLLHTRKIPLKSVACKKDIAQICWILAHDGYKLRSAACKKDMAQICYMQEGYSSCLLNKLGSVHARRI
jgi:hypothetical protein